MNYNNAKGQLTYQIEIDKQQKNGFPIPCDFYSTGKLGLIYPTQALSVTYGDKINNTSSAAVQFNPLAVPIMANMFIKQEHYYTPRNCVWQNWDNFISGGEDMQFTTPPPSFTMYQLFRHLTDLLHVNYLASLSFKVAQYQNGAVVSPEKYYYPNTRISLNGSNFVNGHWINAIKGDFEAFAKTYGLSDLYKNYIQSVVNEIQQFLQDRIELYGKHEYLYLFASKWLWNKASYNDISADDKRAILPPDFVKPDYYATVEKSLPTAYIKIEQTNGDVVDSTEKLELYLTEDGYKFYSLIWKLYKPFIGEGSYIDCLNMNRMVFSDFMYVCYKSFLDNYLSIPATTTTTAISNLSVEIIGQNDVILDVLSDIPMDALNLRTLYLIWYNNYRDQLLELDAMKPRNTDNITNDELIILTIPRHRCWEKDSYTTALDNPATADAVVPTTNTKTHQTLTMKSFAYDGVGSAEMARNDGTIFSIKFQDGETFRIPTGFISGLTPELLKGIKTPSNAQTNTTSAYFSLHMLDAVKRGQKFLRKALFFGNRIQDFIYSTWAVQHLDARLRLPEILSTSSHMVELQTLVNNTTVVGSTVAGDRAGLAKGYDKGNSFNRFCEEAGVIMSLFTIMPEPTYAYGSDRQYYKFDRFEYPIPEFATLGMDAVYDSELVCLPTKVAFSPTDPTPTAAPRVFGYQGRYYDSKFRQSTEHGELLTTQDMYTFGRRWNMYDPEGRPVLNYEFVHCFPPLDMFVMEDQTEDYFRMNVHHDTKAELTLPYHSIYL